MGGFVNSVTIIRLLRVEEMTQIVESATYLSQYYCLPLQDLRTEKWFGHIMEKNCRVHYRNCID